MNIIPYQENLKELFTSKSKLLLLLASLICMQQVQSQSDKNYRLAEEYFAAGEYLTAATLYEQYLHPSGKNQSGSDFPLFASRHTQVKSARPVNKLDVLYKQAESYRLAHYWQQASDRYRQCFEKDKSKYATALYWYATSQRSIGNYNEAEQSLHDFLRINTDSWHKTEAQKELATLHLIRQQLSKPDSILYTIKKINALLSHEKGAYAPFITPGGDLFFTSAVTDSLTKPGINPYHNRLFRAEYGDNDLQNIQPVEIAGIDESLHQSIGSLSPDGRFLYFTQWKKENGKNISAIYLARKDGSSWSNPVKLAHINVDHFSSRQPFFSPDGKYLYFASDRPGGYGRFDIWLAPLLKDGTTEAAFNAGTVINTPDEEQSPFYHTGTNTLVFSSDRSVGMGGYDLYAAKGKENAWELPVNLGHPVNSSRDDLYFFAGANEDLLTNAIVSSDRGSDCCMEMYTITKSPKHKKLKGSIRDCRTQEPMAGAEVVLKSETGDSLVAITDEKGSYQFDLQHKIANPYLQVTKPLYKTSSEPVGISSVDESEWLTDIMMSAPICLEKKLVIKVENVVTVYFDFDKSDLKDRGRDQLDSIYTILNENIVATLQISGYTDGLGSVEYNKRLSDRRAKSCADYLISKGIDAARISFESFGACCPIEMELINGRDNPDGRSKNRRALINISRE